MVVRLAKKLSFAAILVFAGIGWAGALFPKVQVDFQHPVVVGSHTLVPGHYVFQEIRGTDQTPVFRVAGPNGQNITLTNVAIRGRKSRTNSTIAPPVHQNSDVVLQTIGGKYYLDKIWVAGRTRSWDFQIPEDVKAQGGMQQETVPAS